MSKLLAPDEALTLVLERARALPAEPVELQTALGRTLAANISSSDDVPPFDNSAMDGFAVRAQDTKGATPEVPVALAVSGESRAGRPAEVQLGAAEAIRISTGAMIPSGADAVVRVEDCEDLGGTVKVHVEVAKAAEIRRAGEDLRAGDRVLERGTELGPAELGVLASVGVAEVSCVRRARVVVLTTGDELTEPGMPLAPGQIRNSNAYTVSAQAARAGGEVIRVSVVPDDYRATAEAIAPALAEDIVIVCGGVSVGAHDHVKAALAELGVNEAFWGVALRPGRPTWFGTKERTGIRPADKTWSAEGPVLVFGLPGNPVSAMVTFHLFVRPALRALAGAKLRSRRTTAVMDEDYGKRPGRAHVVRCKLEARDDGFHVRPTKEQGSHVLTSMLGAEALALIDAEQADVAAGERVTIELL